ncbi:Zn(2)-C6 fungal-type DNA-binding domain protein [Niveomyces insectorum RCEF 264]|uniref:Zn(2)-C6 fungal-type DNA-binding domain protein n=1 Tax=Niveomyces insectorum RCEF 264 TaxID=1081102 RepID=A0A167SHY1_9HYPO|nr:Zn(2)-C6 fungal-type DNA-binding domain protein [Niveomyces insectorum RCEF 264]
MAPARQAQTACWTCRVRKKKCDRRRPVCLACATLHITCHENTGDRPAWMDNGVKQAGMTQTIKAQIRQATVDRRPNPGVRVSALQTSYAFGLEDMDAPVVPAPPGSRTGIVGATGPESDRRSSGNNSDGSLETAATAMRGDSLSTSTTSATAPSPSPSPLDLELRLDALTLGDVETDLTALYLDYVFPFLFPYYRPAIFEGGRSWLLDTLKTSPSLFHTAMSLSAYFLALYLQTADSASDATFGICSRYVWLRLEDHIDRSVRTIQDDIAELRAGATNVGHTGGCVPTPETPPPPPPSRSPALMRRARAMESVIQLQIFELAMARTVGDWEVHLVAAVTLLEDILGAHGKDDASGQPSIHAIITAMDRPDTASLMGPYRRVWNTDQGAFRFFASVLLCMDILASTTLQTAPRLQQYHASLVSFRGVADSEMGQEWRLRLEDVVGCEGWVLVCIGDVAALDAWKKKTRDQDGPAQHKELAARSREIAERLDDGLDRLAAAMHTDGSNSVPRLQAYYRYRQDDCGLQRDQTQATRIWAHAAKIYLCIVTSGSTSINNATVRDSVATVLRLLQDVPTPAILRSLAWPFFVAGCVASEEQEHEFRALFAAAGALRAFGGLVTAFRIVERVWELRHQINGATWDLSQCATVLGSRPLLM